MADCHNTLIGVIWKAVPSFPSLFVTNDGRVKRICFVTPSQRMRQPTQLRPEKTLNPWLSDLGYYEVRVKIEGKRRKLYVHRLVCEAFHGPAPFEGATVDHLNGDRTDNRAENLEWVSRAKNTRRQNLNGRGVPRGERHPSAVLRDASIPKIFQLRSKGISVRDIAAELGASTSIIYKVLKGTRRALKQSVAPPV